MLEIFPNPAKSPYLIEFNCPEFTCVCPKTGQPDFATLKFSYVPDKVCVELKSLKLYLGSFRNQGHFHEKVTNQICETLQELLNPIYLKVIGDFAVRGGIKTVVTVTKGKRPPEIENSLHV
jgi:7-cyano-7-deazaguanine reductase